VELGVSISQAPATTKKVTKNGKQRANEDGQWTVPRGGHQRTVRAETGKVLSGDGWGADQKLKDVARNKVIAVEILMVFRYRYDPHVKPVPLAARNRVNLASRNCRLAWKGQLMFINVRRCRLFWAPLLFAAAVSAQQSPPNQSSAGRISLDVMVAEKSRPPVSGLQQQDFTVLDNKVPQTLTSFQAVDGRQATINVILLIDAVNTDFQRVNYERSEIDKFLRAEGGHLAYPTALAVLTDAGVQLQQDFSSDGHALSSALDQFSIGLRTIRRDTGFYGAAERYEISLQGLRELVGREAARPGRKIILWVSPGWPLLSGPNVQLDAKQHQKIFLDVVNLSTQLRQARITLYSIDPLGTADAATVGNFYWKDFVKGISKPDQSQPGNLGLQVLATQSGGIALSASNDIADLLQKCIADVGAYYELSFNSATGDQPNQYHNLEIRVAKPGLTARTRQGYYTQP
jgi:VWFA-related protein